ncbi:MAG TPA: hypothetical protein VKU40_12615 [Thermoanaerobaculia bacterium]|nr:hypothetical protein [Thermoanaerobaculia bacterium]
MTTKTTLLALAAAALVVAAAPALAQDGDDFSGEIRIGYRSVDTGGAETKYREDLNLEDGPRLFRLAFDFHDDGSLGGLVDRVRLDVDHLGGDPFETLSLGVQKFDAFKFTYDRRESDYFYQDVLIPRADFDVRLSNGGDFHHFDFERVQDSARLDLRLSERAKFHFGFDSYGKRGEATTTLDISRDEFELERVIDETSETWTAGVEYAWDDVTLVLEERVRDFEDAVDVFAAGATEGENPPPNAAALDFYFLDQPYEYTAREHVVRVVATPGRWTIRGQALLQDLDMDVEASERASGTDFRGNPFALDDLGAGEIDRDLDLFDVDFSYLVSDRVAIIGGAYSRSLDQDGDFTFADERNLGAWEIDTTGVEAGVEVAATTTVTVSGGVRWEEREVRHDAAADAGPGDALELDEETTEHTGYFGNLSWRPTGTGFTMTALVDSSSFDDPFTLASPTDRLRWRLRANYAIGETGFKLSGALSSNTSDNDDSGWESTYDQANFQLSYAKPGFDASLGWSTVEIDREIDQSVNGGAFFFPIDYEAEADFLDGRVRWRPSERWTLGGSLRLYENDGSFGLERDDFRAYVDYVFEAGYTVGLAYRTVDYDEETFNFDDYDADVIEASVGYRW